MIAQEKLPSGDHVIAQPPPRACLVSVLAKQDWHQALQLVELRHISGKHIGQLEI
jgi:hypothetical protein